MFVAGGGGHGVVETVVDVAVAVDDVVERLVGGEDLLRVGGRQLLGVLRHLPLHRSDLMKR